MSDPHHDDDEPATRRVPAGDVPDEDVPDDAPTRVVPARQILDSLSEELGEQPSGDVAAGDGGQDDAPTQVVPARQILDSLSESLDAPLGKDAPAEDAPTHKAATAADDEPADDAPTHEAATAANDEPAENKPAEGNEPADDEPTQEAAPTHKDEPHDAPAHEDEPHEDEPHEDEPHDAPAYEDEPHEDEPASRAARPRRWRGCLLRAALIVVALLLIGGLALYLVTRRDPLVTRPETPPERVLIRNVRVIDVVAGKARAGMDVLLQGDKIHSVTPHSPTAKPAAGTAVVDGSGKSLIPGLIDIHCHLNNSPAPMWDPRLPDADLNLERLLYSGVTRTLDPASVTPDIFELRSDVRAGERLGPTIYAAGPMFTAPDGHPVPMIRETLPSFIADRVIEGMTRQVSSEAEVKAALDALSSHAPDVIKLAIDRIPLDAPRLDPKLAAAIVREAKARKLRVVAHIGTTEDALDAGRAGVSAWIHGVYKERIPDDAIAKLAAFKIPMAPTLVVFRSHAEAGRGRFPSTALERETVDESLLDARADVPTDFEASKEAMRFLAMLTEQQKSALDNVRRLHEAGVVIMAGSDCQPNVVHGPGLHREMQLLIAAKLPPDEVLRAATLHPARFLSQAKDPPFGIIATGKQADLVLVDGDPLAQPEAVSKIVMVFLAGVPLDRHPLPPP